MFSPYYHAARRRGDADPANHVAMNVALYGPGGGWAMTERGRRHLTRDATCLRIGPSSMQWRDGVLTVSIDEVAVPLPRRLRGTITLRPAAVFDTVYALDARHRWTPIAPCAEVSVDFQRPDLQWSGHGYLDSNDGDAPLESAFAEWNWSRVTRPDGATEVFYDMTRIDGSRHALAKRFTAQGASDIEAPPGQALPRGLWGMRGTAPGPIVRRFEDAPFYTRSLIGTGVHESLSLTRFQKPWVRRLLPFRMPRRG